MENSDEWTHVPNKECKLYSSYNCYGKYDHILQHFNQFSCELCKPKIRKGKVIPVPHVKVEEAWYNKDFVCTQTIVVCGKHSQVLTARTCECCKYLFHDWSENKDNDECAYCDRNCTGICISRPWCPREEK